MRIRSDKLRTENRDLKLKVGVAIVAVGAGIFDASNAAEFGYGCLRNVISHMELEIILESTGPTGGRLSVHTLKRHRKAWSSCFV
ncbi:MAG: hypothetical protein N3F10_07345 [Candidatus Bathyarchaeota archaeon]|nr:hypothetical protein [Candidatus Bathyarchaeota archaeon]